MSAPPDATVRQAKSRSSFRGVATHLTLMEKAALELGHIAMHWAWIEDGLNQLVGELAHLDEPDVRNAICGNTDLRGKIQMAKGLAFIRKPTDDWLEATLGILDYIDNDLRVRRNNFTHAGWFAPKGRLIRKTQRTKLLKPQAFKLKLETEQLIPVKLAELRRLKTDLDNVWIDLFVIHVFIMPGTPWARGETPPPKSFRQYLRLQGYGTRLRYERSKRKHRPQSSRA